MYARGTVGKNIDALPIAAAPAKFTVFHAGNATETRGLRARQVLRRHNRLGFQHAAALNALVAVDRQRRAKVGLGHARPVAEAIAPLAYVGVATTREAVERRAEERRRHGGLHLVGAHAVVRAAETTRHTRQRRQVARQR